MTQSKPPFPHGARRLDPDSDHMTQDRFVQIDVDGRSIAGLVGEPVAVAMMAAGMRVFLMMPKSGQPRGGFCFSGRCADCLVTVDGQPGVRACMTKVVEGMRVTTHLTDG